IGTCKKRERFFMLRNFTLSGDIPEGREIDLRREMDALQLRLRDGVIRFCPKADVGRKLGDALLNLRITHFALVGAGRARRVIYQPVELWIVEMASVEADRRHLLRVKDAAQDVGIR